MNEVFGWKQGSNMPSIYVHLSGRDVDNALLKTYGIATDTGQSPEGKLKPKACLRCKSENPSTNKFCSRCGTVLDQQTASEIVKKNLEQNTANQIMDRLIQDEEFRTLLERKVREMASSHH